MTLFVDTSVWSLAFRRDQPSAAPEVDAVRNALEGGETIVIKAGRTFEVIARNKLDGHFVASPAAGSGKVFLRADDRLYAVGK